jgi:ABC-type transport system involved in cytochrome c biogenesis ATPase subunit
MAVLCLVEVQGLTCERGGRRIFRDISFAAATGQVLTLEGPNGAGRAPPCAFSPASSQAAGEIRMQMTAAMRSPMRKSAEG